MPKEETENKKFKAVTEEVAPIEEQKEEKETDKLVEGKQQISVPATDNIISDTKPQKGDFLKIFLVTFFATLLAFLLAGGIYVYLTGVKSNNTNVAGVATPVATIEPQPTDTPTPVDLSVYKISVLNGNGGIGVASAAKTVLESGGFSVSKTGNADSFDFTDTLIQVKSSVPDSVVGKIKDTLASKYSVSVGDPLGADSSYDIVVTVGSK